MSLINLRLKLKNTYKFYFLKSFKMYFSRYFSTTIVFDSFEVDFNICFFIYFLKTYNEKINEFKQNI